MFTLHVFHATRGRWIEKDLGQLKLLHADPLVNLWLDLDNPSDEEARVLSEVFAFHPLAIEYALQDYGHPKIDTFDNHVFMIVHGIDFAKLDLKKSLDVSTAELDLFFGARYLVTHHADSSLKSIKQLHLAVEDPGHRPWTPVRLLHFVLGRLVDNFLPVMDEIGAKIEDLEDQIVHKPTPALLETVLEAKKSVLRIRRMTAHQRLILESLARGHLELIPRESPDVLPRHLPPLRPHRRPRRGLPRGRPVGRRGLPVDIPTASRTRK